MYGFFRPIEILIKKRISKDLNNRYLMNNYRPVDKEIF